MKNKTLLLKLNIKDFITNVGLNVTNNTIAFSLEDINVGEVSASAFNN
jgi:hypothetical protein